MFNQHTKINIDEINANAHEHPRKFVARSETYYKKCVRLACDSAIANGKNIILLTGPSSSGKTTTSKLLSHELATRGKEAVRISLDNFYRNRSELPFWEDGSRNYEAIEGLDLELFPQFVNNLIHNGKADMPVFDFVEGVRAKETYEISYDEDTFVIFEGIHALNPKLTELIHFGNFFRLYVSPHTDFVKYDDEGNERAILTPRNLRLIRRISRDSFERSTSADFTLSMWEKVCLGEEKYIKPFRENADFHIDSTHFYEPFLYLNEIEKLLVDVQGEFARQAFEILQILRNFGQLPKRYIPITSLLREFLNMDNIEVHFAR